MRSFFIRGHEAPYLVDHSGTRRLHTGARMTPAEAHVTRALFELTA